MSRKYVLDRACLQCTMGSGQGKLKVTSQKKLYAQGRKMATDQDKQVAPTFGDCKAGPTPVPCVPDLQQWQNTSKKVGMGDKKLVMEDSQIPCRKGGLVTVNDHTQKASSGPTAQASLLADTVPFCRPVVDDQTTGPAADHHALFDAEVPPAIMVNPTPPETPLEPLLYHPKKSFVGTGMSELIPSEKNPTLKGDILFCHGYHSSPVHNEEGTLWNAPTKQNPDDPGYFTKKGENADEYDHTNPDDIYTDDELNEDLPVDKRQEDAAIKEAIANPGFLQFKFSDARQHWNYWNGISNKFSATETYARYFNASGREHYINGSHGMGSAAHHRIDHGISLGYTWARQQWDILDRETVENNTEHMPSVESHSPAYRPVTVVGHSQGCATAMGVVLGVLRYAGDLKWKQIPINIILLGVHQNYGFSPDGQYTYQDVIAAKAGKYEIIEADFWDGYPLSPTFNEADTVKSLFNGLSGVFDVSNHRKGIDEHGEAITKNWSTIKGRAVQFTFCNDRGDTVFRDGDIKTMASACNPQPNTSFLSVEFFKNGDPVNPNAKSTRNSTLPLSKAEVSVVR